MSVDDDLREREWAEGDAGTAAVSEPAIKDTLRMLNDLRISMGASAMSEDEFQFEVKRRLAVISDRGRRAAREMWVGHFISWEVRVNDGRSDPLDTGVRIHEGLTMTRTLHNLHNWRFARASHQPPNWPVDINGRMAFTRCGSKTRGYALPNAVDSDRICNKCGAWRPDDECEHCETEFACHHGVGHTRECISMEGQS